MKATVVGAGWLGSAVAAAAGTTAAPRRSFRGDLERDSMVFVASGRAGAAGSWIDTLRAELVHLRRVLDACERAGAKRVVVLGSSDVAGAASEVRGTTPQAPLTPYARVKTALEDECVLRADAGMPITCVRLAPVHGPGKRRTRSLIRMARQRMIPVPSGGRHSIGFILLDDAVSAIRWLGENPAPPVVSLGGGPTPLRDLLGDLAIAQGRARPRMLPVPVPTGGLRRAAALSVPDGLHWALRLSLPRDVVMESPVPVTPLPEAAAMLVATC